MGGMNGGGGRSLVGTGGPCCSGVAPQVNSGLVVVVRRHRGGWGGAVGLASNLNRTALHGVVLVAAMLIFAEW